MSHSIITVLATTAVALHAMLGCCAHHAHSCYSHESGLAISAPAEADDHCSCGHHNHDEESEGPARENLADGCSHEHHGCKNHGCDEDNCSFTSAQRSNEVELILTFSMWCQTLGDASPADAIDRLLSLHSATEMPPDPLSLSGTARAKTQVWRL